MRHWHLLNCLRHASDRPDLVQCVLTLEELEAREVLSPVVAVPYSGTPVQTPANTPYTFSSSAAFQASDVADVGQNYRVALTATNGTLSVDAANAQSLGLELTNDKTATVTLVG